MGIRETIVKAFSRMEVPYELTNGNNPPVVEGKSLPTIPPVFWPADVWSGRVSADLNLSRSTAYYASALAYICINYRANKLNEPPLMVVEETDDGDEWIEDHELNGLLAHPNADFTMRRMQALTSIYRDITGAALWLKVRNNGKETVRLYPFSNDEFTVESTEDRLFGLFRIETRGGQIESPPEDVIFFAGIDPGNPVGAVSPLDVALRVLGVGEELRTAARSTLTNAMAPSGAITVPEVLGDAEFTRMMNQLLSQNTGRNRGKPLLLTGGATWQTLQLSLSEMMPGELITWIEATVCAIFQLHPALLGLKSGLENSPWSHLATAKRMLYDEMAIPRWTADAEILTEQLLRDIDFDESHLIRFDTDSIAALQEDILEKVQIAEKGLGFMTVDEKRSIMGFEPVGGDVGETIFVPGTWMPADMVVDPPEPEPLPNTLPPGVNPFDPAAEEGAEPGDEEDQTQPPDAESAPAKRRKRRIVGRRPLQWRSS